MAQVTAREYTLTASPVTLTTALGLSQKLQFSHAVLRAGVANAGVVYVGESGVTTAANRGGYIQAEESLTLAIEGQWMSTDQIWIAGTNGDILHLIMVT